MASSMTAKIFDFISRYFLPANFLDSTGPLSADWNRMLNFKSFHRSFSGPGLVPRGANSTEEQCYQPSRVVEPYDKIVRRPVDYLLSIPGKDIRGKLIDAFNEWLQVPREKLAIIKDIIDMLHTASLLIDDIQDASRLRRDHPVAHEVFGVAQTINAANYAYFLQQERLRELNDPRAFHIFTQALLDLHRGQGMDLYWRDSVVCPTEEEYNRMVIYKTGGLFRLALELMQTQSAITTDLSKLIELLGLIFQIRDDYMNLHSGDYAEKKGSMEDLTEGKFSYPVIHSIHAAPENTELVDILKQRSDDNVIKLRAARYMESTGSYQYCREVLSRLNKQARSQVEEIEVSLGSNNGIHLILDLLHVNATNGKVSG